MRFELTRFTPNTPTVRIMTHIHISRFSSRFVALLLWALAIASLGTAQEAQPFLSPLFADNMVLQRDKPNRFWGWSEPGETIRVEAGNQSASAVVATDGHWEVSFTPPPTGGPYMVRVEGPESVELSNVLVGDVWLCTGQSNMAFGLNRSIGGPEAAKAADLPNIRFFGVSRYSAYAPTATPGGTWEVCSPDTAGRFSAVAFYFGRRLQADLNVPIGLIRSAVGGTTVECWMSPQALAAFPEYTEQMAELDRLRGNVPTEYGSFLMHWLDDYDIGENAETPWQSYELNDSDWADVSVPNGVDDLGMGEHPGVIWLRKEVVLPNPLPEGGARLFLGQVDKMDTSYFNGEWVGASSWVDNPRRHRVSEDLLRPGKNVIAIRVFKRAGEGGIPSGENLPRLELGDGTVISLAGKWKGKVSVDARPPHKMPLGFENYPSMPTVNYQGMLHPIVGLAIRGAVWYQGEANFQEAEAYRGLLPAMIADWREAFGQGDLPFYVVGLPAFMQRKAEPSSDGWTELREAQWLATRVSRRTALAVTVDTGDADDIHPREKLSVGVRTALLALGEEYGQDVVWHGPELASITTESDSIRVHFDHVAGGLVVKGDTLGEFSIAGEDRVWHWAKARVEGDTVVVSSPDVPEPIAVRYAWQANPVANLYNEAGLPAVPFRTAQW